MVLRNQTCGWLFLLVTIVTLLSNQNTHITNQLVHMSKDEEEEEEEEEAETKQKDCFDMDQVRTDGVPRRDATVSFA